MNETHNYTYAIQRQPQRMREKFYKTHKKLSQEVLKRLGVEDVGEQGRNSLSVLMGNLKLVIFAMLIFPHLALKETTVVARM